MQQNLALEIMLEGHNVLLTGPAGAGKTYVLNDFIKRAKKAGKYVSVTASTGLAATHLGGNTVHAWSGIGVNDHLSSHVLDHLSKSRRDIIIKSDVLIIDEISMLHDFRLDMIDQVARQVRDSNQPFGGLQIILCGDFFQLPPINRDDSRPGGFVVDSEVWPQLDLVVCYLSEQHRQDDGEFLQILEALRNQDLRRRHLQWLLARQNQAIPASLAVTELHTTNVDVDRINAAELAQLKGKSHFYERETTGGSRYVDSLQKSCLAPETLELKKGALVMCIKNSPDRKFVNGSLGVVVGFDKDTDLPIVELNSGRRLVIGYETWELRDGSRKRASLSQIPLRLAWAITVHKSQGMTLDAARIDLSKAFVEGMGYVALSRVRGLDSLCLLGLNRMALKVSPVALEIDEQLRSQSQADSHRFADLLERAKQRPQEAVKDRDSQKQAWANKLAKMRKKFPNAYRPWAAADDVKLEKLFNRGKKVTELTTVFGRHPGSIEARLKKLLGEDVLTKP